MAPAVTIDCHYQRPEHAAAYLLIEKESAALVDNNTVHAIPYILEALSQHHLRPEQIQYLIPTHLHLDHAGATSALAKICTNAIIISHPRAVRHYADPARLIAGAKAVYGEAQFTALFGEIVPIPAERIRSVDDNERITFGQRTLTFLHTRGHANHSISIHDDRANGVYTGDTFGVEYRKSRQSKKPFLFCSTAPTDFDPAETRISVNRLLSLHPQSLYLAHFGELTEIEAATEVFIHFLNEMEELLSVATDSSLSNQNLVDSCRKAIFAAIMNQYNYCGVEMTSGEQASIDSHLNINAQGIGYAAEKRRQK